MNAGTTACGNVYRRCYRQNILNRRASADLLVCAHEYVREQVLVLDPMWPGLPARRRPAPSTVTTIVVSGLRCNRCRRARHFDFIIYIYIYVSSARWLRRHALDAIIGWEVVNT